MKLTYAMAFAAALAFTACGSNANKPGTGIVENDSDEIIVEEMPALDGQWQIENIVESDSKNIRPAEIESDGPQYFMFNTDGTFGATTNCNSVNGDFSLSGDSITFSNLMSTRMACPDMSVEESLQRILPDVKTVDWTSDSIIRLNTSTPSKYIVLKLMAEAPAQP